MYRILTASSLLALAAVPALAQEANPLTTPPAEDAPMTTQEAPAPAAEPSTQAPADQAPANQAAPATAEPKEVTVAKLVDAEFPTYDADKNGDLNQPEFAKWMLALQAASGDAKAKAMDQATKDKWAKAAFAAADADKSKKVSKTEMNKFLLG